MAASGELRMGAGGEEGRKEDSASDNHGRPGKETKEGHGKQKRGRGEGVPHGGGTLEERWAWG